jgi:spore germination protein GerM
MPVICGGFSEDLLAKYQISEEAFGDKKKYRLHSWIRRDVKRDWPSQKTGVTTRVFSSLAEARQAAETTIKPSQKVEVQAAADKEAETPVVGTPRKRDVLDTSVETSTPDRHQAKKATAVKFTTGRIILALSPSVRRCLCFKLHRYK